MEKTFAFITTRKRQDKIKTILFYEISEEQWQQGSLDKLYSREEISTSQVSDWSLTFEQQIPYLDPGTRGVAGGEETVGNSQAFIGWLDWWAELGVSIQQVYWPKPPQNVKAVEWKELVCKGQTHGPGIFTVTGLWSQKWILSIWNWSQPLPSQIP